MRTKNFRPLAVALQLLVAAGLACTTVTDILPAPTPQGDPTRQATVDALQALTAGLDFPEHFEQENPVRTGQEFDPNRYFEVLNHLAMEPGYTLDYVYQFDGMGGYPVLYARQADEPALQTFADYEQAAPDDYLLHVQTDGSEEGFYQLALLTVMGGQFYLWWHAGYFDAEVIADGTALEAAMADAQGFCGEWPKSAVAEARRLPLTPVVEPWQDDVTVTVIVFSKWGGFTRRTLTFAKAFPHRVLDADDELLVDVECNVVF